LSVTGSSFMGEPYRRSARAGSAEVREC
jgi:hypothetical protein